MYLALEQRFDYKIEMCENGSGPSTSGAKSQLPSLKFVFGLAFHAMGRRRHSDSFNLHHSACPSDLKRPLNPWKNKII